MNKKRGRVVIYSNQSLKNAREIVAYLNRKFSDKEINKYIL